MTRIVEKTRYYVKQRLLSELKPEDGYYRYTHSLRVADICGRIARAEGLDEEMLLLGGLLHDIGYVACRRSTDYADHGLKSAEIAREYLLEQGYDPEKTESICYGIRIHTQEEETRLRPGTALEESISDADNIDRFDAWRFSRSLYWDGLEKLHMTPMGNLARTRVQRMKQLRSISFATDTARKLWNEKLDLWVDFYTRLERQTEVTLRWDPEI